MKPNMLNKLVALFLISSSCIILPAGCFSYPVFGTKRYQRANMMTPIMQQSSLPAYPSVPRYYDNTGSYDSYYSGDESTVGNNGASYNSPDNYYYYPSPRHEIPYNSYGLPTYRGEYKPSPYYYAHAPSYNYYEDRASESGNPLDDLHEEMMQEDERERQRDLLPVGQETWYENSPARQDALAMTNANFLRNLILYNKQLNQHQAAAAAAASAAQQIDEQSALTDFDDYSEMDAADVYKSLPVSSSDYNMKNYEQIPIVNEIEDEDVRELKSLANQRELSKSNSNDRYHNENIDWQKDTSSLNNYEEDPEYDDAWINWDSKRSFKQLRDNDAAIEYFNNRKSADKLHSKMQPSSTTVATTTITDILSKPTKAIKLIENNEKSDKTPLSSATTSTTTNLYKGQKEVVLPRPANPVRMPFTAPVMTLLKNAEIENSRLKNSESKTTVYDTIKQLLAMEENLTKNNGGNGKHRSDKQQSSHLQKRFVSSEEALVDELDDLKRMAA